MKLNKKTYFYIIIALFVSFLIVVLFHVLSINKFIDKLEFITYDTRWQLKTLLTGQSNKPDKDIILLNVDSYTENMITQYKQLNLGPLPWPRKVFADVIKYLSKYKAKAIVFALRFPYYTNPIDDKKFNDALKYSKNCYMVVGLDQNLSQIEEKLGAKANLKDTITTLDNELTRNINNNPSMQKHLLNIDWNIPSNSDFLKNITFFGITETPKEFLDNFKGLGFINIPEKESSEVIRSAGTIAKLGETDNFLTSLELKVALDQMVPPDNKIKLINQNLFIGNKLLNLDQYGNIYINWRGKPGNYTSIPIVLPIISRNFFDDSLISLNKSDFRDTCKQNNDSEQIIQLYDQDIVLKNIEYLYFNNLGFVLDIQKNASDDFNISLENEIKMTRTSEEYLNQYLLGYGYFEELTDTLNDNIPYEYLAIIPSINNITKINSVLNNNDLFYSMRPEFASFKNETLSQLNNFNDLFIDPSIFTNKIVIIGYTSTGTDIHNTPMGNNFPGSEIVATMIDSYLNDNQFVKKSEFWVNLLLVLLFSALVLISYKIKQPALYFLSIISIIIVYIIVSIVVFSYYLLWIPVIWPIIILIFVSIASIAWENLFIKSAFTQIYKLSIIDGLTGLYNHRYFKDKLSEAVEIAKKQNNKVSIIMLDIDFFKKINDTYGHLAGDEILKGISKVIKNSVRQVDIVARYGGEEISILLDSSNIDKAIEIANTIILNVSNHPFKIASSSQGIKITVSAGVGCYPDTASDVLSLINFADKCLYNAKNSGRNRLGDLPTGQPDDSLPSKMDVYERTKANLSNLLYEYVKIALINNIDYKQELENIIKEVENKFHRPK